MKVFKASIVIPQVADALEYTGENFNELKEFVNCWTGLLSRYNSWYGYTANTCGEVDCTYDEQTKVAYFTYGKNVDIVEIGDVIVKDRNNNLEILRKSVFNFEYRDVNTKKPILQAQELAKLLRELCYNEDNDCIDLSNLDFTPYRCSVKTSGMKVDGNLYQEQQTVGADLVQGECHVKRNIFQADQYVDKNLFQDTQMVGCNLFQANCYVEGNIEQNNQRAKGKIIDDEKTC